MRRIAPVLVALVVGSLVLSACGDDQPGLIGDTGETAPIETAATGPTLATGPTAATGATGAVGETKPTTDLEDGRHFVYIEQLDADGAVTFDLAYFYTGDEATEQAEAHGDEAPPPNDYYIVNDNPKLRELPIADDVRISVFDWNNCCDTQVIIDVATFAEVMANPSGFIEMDGALYYGVLSPYWLTLEGGVVTGIEEQYLP